MSGNTIIKCDNPICQVSFSVIMYSFADEECTNINTAHLIPLSGNTPYFCPCCGKNLGKSDRIPEVPGPAGYDPNRFKK